jgi:hypothetical protein
MKLGSVEEPLEFPADYSTLIPPKVRLCYLVLGFFKTFNFASLVFFALGRVEIGNLKNLGTFLHNIILR